METYDRGEHARFEQRARAGYRQNREAMARLRRKPAMSAGVTPDAHTPEDLNRRARFYDDMSKTIHNRKLEARCLSFQK